MANQLILSLISGIFISGVAAYLGTLMLSRKMSVIAEPIAHLALPGVAIALIYGWSLFFGVFPFVLIGIIFIWYLERKTKLPIENLAAIIFAVSIGFSLLILPIDKAEEALVGNIDKILNIETIFTILISLIIIFLVQKIYKKIMFLNISEDLAEIYGIKVGIYNFLYLLVIALTVSLSVYLVGGLITAALIAIPSAASKNISFNLKTYQIWSIIFGISSAILGILINYFYHFPAGPLIIILGGIIFILTVLIKSVKNE
jgi:ABC-type Mn2+/Zn2+ transport system permease subunit